MAANTFNVTEQHNGFRIPLHGDMEVTLNLDVTNKFSIILFCKTKELFTVRTNKAILNLSGASVQSLQIGGRIGASYEMMFNAITNTWEFTKTNIARKLAPQLINRLPWETVG